MSIKPNVLLVNPAPSLIKYGMKYGFEKNGCNVILLEEIMHMKNNDAKISLIKETIEKHNIDLLFCEYYAVLPLRDISNLCKEKNVQFHYWAIEDPVTPHCGNHMVTQKYIDFIWTTTIEFIPKYIEMGTPSDLLLFGCNPEILPEDESPEFKHDISLVGSNYSNRYDKVRDFLFPLIRDNFDLQVYGIWWMNHKLPISLCKCPQFYWKKEGDHALPYQWLPKVVNSSKIMFGLNCQTDMSVTQTSCRPYETLSCSKNSVYLSWYTEAQNKIFGNYVFQAKCGEELVAMARNILNMSDEERIDMATKAREYVHKCHDYKLRAKQVIDKFVELRTTKGV